MRCYLGGPMRGLPLFNFPAFYAAEADLAAAGWTVHNPARWDEEVCGFDPRGTIEAQGFSTAAALRHDIEVITTWADAVFVLPGWEASEGARLEVVVAQSVGIPVWVFGGGAVSAKVTTAVAA